MPRKRVIDITESLDELRRLAADNAGTPAADPIRMLIALKKHPAATTNDIAAMTDCTPRQVERALAVYRSYGIAGLLERVASSTLRPGQLDELRAAMSAGTLETLEEIRAWIEERFGLRYTTRGIGKLVQREFGARRGWVFDKSENLNRGKITGSLLTTIDRMISFLSSLESTGDIATDIDNMRYALQSILSDVDRVSAYINAVEDSSPVPIKYLTIIDQKVNFNFTPDFATHLQDSGSKPSEIILDHFRSQNMPLHQYGLPVPFDYYDRNTEYIGTIILWHSISKPPISKATKLLMERLEPFIVYLMMNIQNRCSKGIPYSLPFTAAIGRIITESSLSAQEVRAITMRLLGHSYQAIADNMHISRSTVRKHLISVHRKTETSSIVEFFAKYFSPRTAVRGNDNDGKS